MTAQKEQGDKRRREKEGREGGDGRGGERKGGAGRIGGGRRSLEGAFGRGMAVWGCGEGFRRIFMRTPSE